MHAASVIGQFGPDAAEFIVHQFQEAGHAAEAAAVIDGNLHSALVTGVVVHVGPGVLEDGSHLHLETIGKTLLGADIVQGHIAETVNFQQFPLVHGIVPVYLEEAVHGRCNLVHILAVERDDAKADDVRNVCQGFVFGTFEFQFAGQGVFRLYPIFHTGNNQAHLLQRFLDGHVNFHGLLTKLRKVIQVFLKYLLRMGIQQSFPLTTHILGISLQI